MRIFMTLEQIHCIWQGCLISFKISNLKHRCWLKISKGLLLQVEENVCYFFPKEMWKIWCRIRMDLECCLISENAGLYKNVFSIWQVAFFMLSFSQFILAIVVNVCLIYTLIPCHNNSLTIIQCCMDKPGTSLASHISFPPFLFLLCTPRGG